MTEKIYITRNVFVLPRKYILILLFCFSVFSIFFNIIKIYQFVFLLFFGTIILAQSDTLILKKSFLQPTLLITSFVLYSIIIFTYCHEQSDLKTLVKLITNLSFLISSFLFLGTLKIKDLPFLKRSICITLEIIILLSFLQLLMNLTITNSWLLPFSNNLNSVTAFQLTEAKVFFGESQKNIWSSKFMLVSIIYLLGYRLKVLQVSYLSQKFYYFIILFCIFFMLSRSAQLAFLLFEFSFHSLKLIKRKSSFKFKLGVSVLVALLLIILLVVSFHLLRLDYDFYDVSKGHGGDGFKARIILWIYFFNNLENLNLIFGNGILFTDYYFDNLFSESNLHNSFLNVFIDSGIIGIFLYLIMALSVLRVIKFKQPSIVFFVQLVPLIAVMNVQYLGYDNDIMIFISLLAVLNSISNKTLPEL